MIDARQIPSLPPRLAAWPALRAVLLLSASTLYASCGGNPGGLSALEQTGNDPALVSNADPMARPTQVGWTAARAQRCGFSFDAGKLKASYIAYETKQGATGDQLARIQKTYDSTLQATSAKVSADASYCNGATTAEIKADLSRHLAGDYTPNLPKPKLAQTCGVFGCPEPIVQEPYDQNTFWQKRDRDVSGGVR